MDDKGLVTSGAHVLLRIKIHRAFGCPIHSTFLPKVYVMLDSLLHCHLIVRMMSTAQHVWRTFKLIVRVSPTPPVSVAGMCSPEPGNGTKYAQDSKVTEGAGRE